MVITGETLADDEDVRAEVEDLLGDIGVDSADESDHGDDRRDADDDAEQGEDGAQLVRPQRLQGKPDSFGDLHEMLPFRTEPGLRQEPVRV